MDQRLGFSFMKLLSCMDPPCVRHPQNHPFTTPPPPPPSPHPWLG